MTNILLMVVAAITLCACTGGPPETGRGQWLIATIKEVADSGALFQPDQVERLLSLRLAEAQTETIKQSPDCKNPYLNESIVRSTYTPQGASWFTSTPEGVPHMVRPGFGINGPAVMGDPVLSYAIFKIVNCSGRHEPKEHTEAKLDFVYASGFACITDSDLKRNLPTARSLDASDGAVIYRYTGKVDDVFSSTVTFDFFVGTQCMMSATIEQSEETGRRHARAFSRFRTCTKQADHEFCQTNRPFSWGDRAMLNLMDDYEIKRCGTFDDYYQREPLSGEAPEPLPPRGYSQTPCDGK